MQKAFKKIILMSRSNNANIPGTLAAITDHLAPLNVTVGIEQNTAKKFVDKKLPIVNEENLTDYDLIIVVGGDGSLLHAAKFAIKGDIPVLGINRGQLGFLTDINPQELNKVDRVLDGLFQEEQRFLLQVSWQSAEKIETCIALNEVALLRGEIPQLTEFETYINQRFVCNQRADGLIIATPTGSTAYALSGGGPILHPNLDAMVLVPMFPHTLSSRPIVVSGGSKIDIIISKNNKYSPYISCDGEPSKIVPLDTKIHISKHKNILRLIHPEDYHYFATLREKLGWERRTTC